LRTARPHAPPRALRRHGSRHRAAREDHLPDACRAGAREHLVAVLIEGVVRQVRADVDEVERHRASGIIAAREL
jgi:hypothetical protein